MEPPTVTTLHVVLDKSSNVFSSFSFVIWGEPGPLYYSWKQHEIEYLGFCIVTNLIVSFLNHFLDYLLVIFLYLRKMFVLLFHTLKPVYLP